jgi:hypothetical protein
MEEVSLKCRIVVKTPQLRGDATHTISKNPIADSQELTA